MRFKLVAAMVPLLLLGCRGPGANFEGTWLGEVRCEGTVRETGEPYSDTPVSQIVTIVVDADDVARFSGVCGPTLSPRTERLATLYDERARPCTTTTATGAPVSVEILGGFIQLDGARMTYELNAVFSFTDPTTTLDATCIFNGDAT